MHENRETSSPTAQKKGSPAGEGESRKTGMNGGGGGYFRTTLQLPG
jgi:hypothetical protein